MSDFCMLGLFERIDNKIQMHVGVGWNINSPVPELRAYYNPAGWAGTPGWHYLCGHWDISTRELENPFLARYSTYDETEKQWGGRHHA